MSENVDEVNEQKDRVHDEVSLSHPMLFNDERRVIHYEAADHQESQVQVSLEQELTTDEDVDQREHRQERQHREQSSSQIEPLPVLREYGCQREASEDETRREESGRNQSRIDHYSHVQEGPDVEASTKGEPHEVRQPGVAVLAIVGSREQSQRKANSAQKRKEASAQEGGIDMDVPTESRGQQRHRHGSVDMFQVLLDLGFQFPVQGVDESTERKSRHSKERLKDR